MQIKKTTVLIFLCFIGCQPKSEIDKCVDAHIAFTCKDAPLVATESFGIYVKSVTECKASIEKAFGYEYRLQCLRAHAGKE